MTKRILFWIDATLDHFGAAKYLQNNSGLEMFAIIDANKGKINLLVNKKELAKRKKKWNKIL